MFSNSIELCLGTNEHWVIEGWYELILYLFGVSFNFLDLPGVDKGTAAEGLIAGIDLEQAVEVSISLLIEVLFGSSSVPLVYIGLIRGGLKNFVVKLNCFHSANYLGLLGCQGNLFHCN